MRIVLSILLISVFCVLVSATERLSERLSAEEGETCVVCNEGVSAGDVAYHAGGQRVAVHQACEAEFLSDPAAHVARLRPSNMIFGAETGTRIPAGWMWLGLFALLGLVFGGLCAQAAVGKGRSPGTSFLLGMFFSVPAYIYLLLQPAGCRRPPLTRAPAPCPGCGHANHPAASQCGDCGAPLKPSARSEVDAVSSV